jgi:predicted alpha-1,6-mannanase (GH76 family)
VTRGRTCQTVGVSAAVPDPAVPDPVERDAWAIGTLLTYFSPRTGRWRTPTGEAWQPALAIEAVLSSFERSRDVRALNVVEKSFARYRGRRSRFFDDLGWYVNVWLRAYDATGDPKYLTEAQSVFVAMTEGWDGRCGGGLWWNEDRTYKNAITNELFLLAAARLHRRTGLPGYRDWAQRTWTWFDGAGLVNSAGLVNDGLDGDCHNNGQTTWTYNQGVLLGGLIELWRITKDGALLATAHRIADATIATLTGDSVLRDPTGPAAAHADTHLFKGILAQHLARLYRVDPQARPGYAEFLTANADAAWTLARDPARGVGLDWARPPTTVTGATHTSASLLFAEVALLHRDEPSTVRAPVDTGTRYEAEQADLDGVGTESRYAGYTGTGYVAGWRRDGQSVRFAVRSTGVCPASVTLRYAAGTGDGYRCLDVDGVAVADGLLFTGTGGWDRYSTVSLDVALAPGHRVVSVGFDSSRGSRNFVNLDSLTLREGRLR